MSKNNHRPKKHDHDRAKKKDASMESEGTSDTIENVASNFMQHVQQTEQDNVTLKKQNEDLEEQIKDLNDKERNLVAEKEVLNKELEELTTHHKRVKDENADLLKKLADSKRENDAKITLLENENKHLEQVTKELEENKAKLTKRLAEMDANMQEFNAKMDKQTAIITELKAELQKLEHSRKTDNNNTAEIKKLKKAIKEKEQLIDDMTKELNKTDSSKNDDRGKTDEVELQILRDALKKLEKDLKTKDDIIGPLEKERNILSAEINKLKETLKSKTKEIEELLRKLESLSSARKAMEKTVKSLKRENSLLKGQFDENTKDKDYEVDNLEEKIRHLNNQIGILKTTESAMADLLKSKENHIVDLRSEITELRNVNNMFKRDLKDLRAKQNENALMEEKYGDMANNHKRTLEENKRLRTMFATKAMTETNAVTEHRNLQANFEESQKKLKSAHARILQLEAWMDQIFRNADYDVVLKSDNSRDSVLSLPEITEPTNGRRGVSRNSLTNGHLNNKRKNPVSRKYNAGYFNRELPGNY